MAHTRTKPMILSPGKMKDLERMSTDKPGLITHPHNVGAFCVQPLDEEESTSQSLLAMRQQTQLQLNQIEEQVQVLTQQALKLQKRFQVSQHIYAAKTSFKPVIGKTYYLYEKVDKKHFLSMIHPDEWSNHPHQFITAVELLADHTWHVVDECYLT